VLNHPVADLQASDPDNANGGIAGYSIFRDALHGSATIDDGVTISYQPDGNYSGSDEFFVQALNHAGLPVVVQFKVEISQINDAPVSRLPLSHTMNEGVGKVLPLLAYDGDGDSVVWTTWLEEDTDFKVLGNVLYFKQDALPDYERAGTDLGYVARLGLQDPQTERTEHNLTIFINNLPDSLPSSALKAGPQGTTFTIPENQAIVADLKVADPDQLEDPNATITGGADAELFILTQEGVLRSINPYGFDFEDANDSNGDNRYELTIDVNDSFLGQSYKVFVVVSDQDESPPYYTSGGGETFYQIPVPEDRLFVTQVMAEDNETEELVYRVAKGADAGFFSIDDANGSLAFVNLQNFENPEDSNGDGTFEVVIGVSDGVFETNQTIFVELEDANDPPVLSLVDYNLSEDGETFQIFEGFDEDGHEIRYQLQTQSAHGFVTVLGAGFNYRPDADFYGFDSFEVLVSDDYSSNVQTVVLLVTPVNDPPVAVDDIKYFYQENRTSDPLILIDVLANDHTGPDDPSEKSSYTVELIGSKSANGNNVNTWSRGVFRYVPGSSFTGEDSFQYRLIDNGQGNDGFVDTATVRVWVATTAKNPDWTNLMFFGMYYHDTNESNGRQNWIYHLDMGWVYVHRPDQLLESTWMWKENVGWFWTGDKYFKWVYHQGLQQWLHWEGGVSSTSGWFLRTEDEVRYYEKDFIRMQVRDEVIEILPDLSGLSDYVDKSSFFTYGERVQVIKELIQFNRSKTLNKILQFDFSY
ncbi:MAG: tandem-95 repeat protein, partial [Opitutae bacterium]